MPKQQDQQNVHERCMCEFFPTGWLSGFAKPAFYSPGLACTRINLGTRANATRQPATAALGHVPNRIRHHTHTHKTPQDTITHIIHYSTSCNNHTTTLIEFGMIRPGRLCRSLGIAIPRLPPRFMPCSCNHHGGPR